MSLRILGLLFLLLLNSTISHADVNVFIYHRFNDSSNPTTNIATAVFAAQLAYLKQEGYQALPLSRIVQLVLAGEPLPEKTVGLCVDDAFTSFATQALPLLESYGFPVTLFVNTASVGNTGYLSWDELQAAMSRGVEIGNHTDSHAYLVEMAQGETVAQWQERIRSEIDRSQLTLKTHLGITPDIFAYTYGEYSPALIDLVREAGFKAAFAQQSGVIYRGSDIWTLPRFPMGGAYASLEGFISKLKTRSLQVHEISPVDPIIRQQNPPELRLKLVNPEVSKGVINCFVQGENTCTVERVAERKDELVVRAAKPLSGRRNKYTLTTLGKDGNWRWYSRLWINADHPVPGPVAQP